jgi:hypothetical protein
MSSNNKISSRKNIAKQICDALGLRNVMDLKIHFPIDGIATITAEMYMEYDGAKCLPVILQKFELVPIGEPEAILPQCEDGGDK